MSLLWLHNPLHTLVAQISSSLSNPLGLQWGAPSLINTSDPCIVYVTYSWPLHSVPSIYLTFVICISSVVLLPLFCAVLQQTQVGPVRLTVWVPWFLMAALALLPNSKMQVYAKSHQRSAELASKYSALLNKGRADVLSTKSPLQSMGNRGDVSYIRWCC